MGVDRTYCVYFVRDITGRLVWRTVSPQWREELGHARLPRSRTRADDQCNKALFIIVTHSIWFIFLVPIFFFENVYNSVCIRKINCCFRPNALRRIERRIIERNRQANHRDGTPFSSTVRHAFVLHRRAEREHQVPKVHTGSLQRETICR